MIIKLTKPKIIAKISYIFKTMENNLNEALKAVGLDKDRIALVVSKESKGEIIYYYQQFGWSLVKDKDDPLGGKFAHLSFERDHFFPHKNLFQYLEVSFEENVNKLNKAKRKKHLWSFLNLLIGFFGGLVLAIVGIVSFFVEMDIPLYGKILMLCVGGIIFLASLILSVPLYKAERRSFNQEFKELAQERNAIFEEIKRANGQ